MRLASLVWLLLFSSGAAAPDAGERKIRISIVSQLPALANDLRETIRRQRRPALYDVLAPAGGKKERP